jgi:hypothetical protein
VFNPHHGIVIRNVTKRESTALRFLPSNPPKKKGGLIAETAAF